MSYRKILNSRSDPEHIKNQLYAAGAQLALVIVNKRVWSYN